MGNQKGGISLPEGTKVPDHIAMILDGNRRWARARGMAPWMGHKAGYEAIRDTARAARRMGVHTFTVWAFSTENWERPQGEIDEIMNLVRRALGEMERELHEEKVRLVHLGRKDRLPKDVLDGLAKLEEETRKHNDSHVFNVALDYGGRDELIRAMRAMTDDQIQSYKIDQKTLEKYLDTHDQPYPNVDLFIRTSGEQRTSGLMPWQMDYAEYYFEPDHLPDFGPEKLREAILDFSRRRRRFGGNDAVEHLKFDPRLTARLELDMRRKLTLETAVAYAREQYGLSKELAKTAGGHLLAALREGNRREWEAARADLVKLYGLVKRNVGLALEPEVLANIEIKFWQDPSEEGMRTLLAEKFRFSALQAGKAAHLAILAEREPDLTKKKGYLERFYRALKERVA